MSDRVINPGGLLVASADGWPAGTTLNVTWRYADADLTVLVSQSAETVTEPIPANWVAATPCPTDALAGTVYAWWDDGTAAPPRRDVESQTRISTFAVPSDDEDSGRLASVAQLREFLIAEGGSRVSDEFAANLLDTASELILGQFDRQLYPTAAVETRTVHVGGTYGRIPDLRPDESTVIVGDGDELDPTTYRLLARERLRHPVHAIVLHEPVAALTITGRWGFDPIPAGITHGTLVWAARAFFKRQARQADITQDDSGALRQYFGGMPSQLRALAPTYTIPGL